MASASSEVIPNRVFVGCPYKTIRPKYERVIDQLRKTYPLSFVIVGRDEKQDVVDLLDSIKAALLTSSYAIFDATGGNANVSLEYGFAEANDIPRALYLSTHAASKKAKDPPIIADLAGKKRNHYVLEPDLHGLMAKLAAGHLYTQRFEKFLRSSFPTMSRGARRRPRSLALKIIHALDGAPELRRADIVQRLLVDPVGYDQKEADGMILKLHQAGLIQSVQGPYSKVRIT